MTPIEKLGQAISDSLDEAPAADVLTILTGAFVGLTVEMVRRQGHDIGKVITVDGGKERDITIHAPKGSEASPAVPERNNPLSALSIRLLVSAGACTQAQADAAFHAACTMLEEEAVRQNLTLPWVTRVLPSLTDEQIDSLMPEPDGSAEANKVRIVYDGMPGYEFDEVDAWSRPLVRQAVRAALTKALGAW